MASTVLRHCLLSGALFVAGSACLALLAVSVCCSWDLLGIDTADYQTTCAFHSLALASKEIWEVCESA